MRELESFLRVAAIVVLYGVVALFRTDDRKRLQQRAFRRIRMTLSQSFGFSKLADLDEEACETGPAWKVLPMLNVLMMGILSIAFVFEGRSRQAMNVALMGTAQGLSAMRFSRRAAVTVARASFLHQIVTLCILQSSMEKAILSRAVITRAFASIMLFGLVDETFFQMLAMSFVFSQREGWDSDLTFLPMRMFFLFLLPMQVLGVREWICSQRWFEERTRDDKKEFLVSTSVPLMTILFTFSGGAENPASLSHLFFLRIIGFVSVALFLVCYLVGDVLDDYVMGNTIASSTSRMSPTMSVLSVEKDPNRDASSQLGTKRHGRRGFLPQRSASLSAFVTDLVGSKEDFFSKDAGRQVDRAKDGEREEAAVGAEMEDLSSEMEDLSSELYDSDHEDEDEDDCHSCNEGNEKESAASVQRNGINAMVMRVAGTVFRRPRGAAQNPSSPYYYEQEDFIKFTLLPLSLMDMIFILTAAAMAVYVAPYSIPFMFALFLLGRHPATRVLRLRWRTVVFWTHTVLLLWVLYRGQKPYDDSSRTWKEKPALVALVTVRMLFSFERRRFSLAERESALIGTLVCFALKENDLVALVAFLLVSSYIVTVIVGFAREHSSAILRREDDSHAFLSHALKQKFSGVGSAAESILEHPRYRSSTTKPSRGNDVFDNGISVKHLLVKILQECRKGQDACHAVNVIRNVQQGRYRGSKSYHVLREMVDQWAENEQLTVKQIQFAGDNEDYVVVELNWELLRILLCQWARGAAKLHVEVFLHDVPSFTPPTSSESSTNVLAQEHVVADQTEPANVAPTVALAVDPGPTTVHASCEIRLEFFGRCAFPVDRRANFEMLAQQLGGYFVQLSGGQDVLCLRGCLAQIERDDRDTGSKASGGETPQSITRTLEEEPAASLPPELRFAILDDNTLVRKNIHRIVLTHLHAATTSFIRGESFEECLAFAQEIIDRDVDVAILDENLDFDQDRLSGSEIARLARQKGFQGCLLLHSAQAATNLDPSFNGFVEKTTSRRDFAQGILEGWQHYLKVTRRSSRRTSVTSLVESGKPPMVAH